MGTCAWKFMCVVVLAGGLAAIVQADAFATIDSVMGRVEIRKAGQTNWIAVTKGATARNNDVVRAAEKSFARLVWGDGSNVFLNAVSQMLINTYENKESKSISHHFTVFWGAAFFVVKQTLPQEFFGREDTKVYTPTTLIAIRGTSFDVGVDRKTGYTDVRVLNGTVLVRNIIRNVSTFLSAGYRSGVAMNNDPEAPAPYMDKQIETLKTWVPKEVVEREMSMQIKKAEAAHEAITALTKNKLIIMPFSNISDYSGAWDLSNQFAGLVAASLRNNAKTVSVDVKGTSSTDPLVLGGEQKARYVVKGTVEEFDIVQRAKITARADEYKEFSTARVKLRLQLVDLDGKKLVYDNVFFGEVSSKHEPQNTWPEISKLVFSPGDAAFMNSIMGKAVQQAVEQYAENLGRYLRGEGN